MKHLILLLCLVPVLCFSQSLERQIYKHYFEYEFKHESAFVRENKISSIVKREIETIGDSVIHNFVLEKTSFRTDGRPIKNEYWYDHNRSIIIKDFTYDSLNNLTEIRDWKPEVSRYEPLKERSRMVCSYDSTRLVKVFYFQPGEHAVSGRCDSLAYSENEKQVVIFSGGQTAKNSFAPNEKPAFIYPILNKHVLKQLSTGDSLKPIDKKSVWETENQCSYKYRPALIKLSEITGVSCLPQEIANTYEKMNKTVENNELIEFISFVDTADHVFNSFHPSSDYSPDSLDLRTIVRIDLKNKKIEFQTAGIMSRPTSMEDIVTYSRTVSHYDFSMRLLWRDQFRADLGRNDFGMNDKSEYKESQIVYDYYENGMLKREVTFFERNPHYINQKGLYMKEVIYEITRFE